MVKLTKALIKKYGITRKAWNIAKSKSGKRGKKTKMAKKKSFKRSKSASFMGINVKRALASAVYGGMRAKVSNYLKPYTDKIPLGNISDEAGMIATSILVKKFIGRKIPFANELTKAALDIEFARIGEAVATGDIGGFGSSTNGENTVIYG